MMSVDTETTEEWSERHVRKARERIAELRSKGYYDGETFESLTIAKRLRLETEIENR